MTAKRKTLIGVAVVALLGVMAYMALRRPRGDRVDVRTEEVGRRDLVSRVTATGHVEARRSVEISADIAGRIVELPVEEGQEVDEGDLLLRIDPTQYRAAVRRQEAALAEARAREARAEAAYRRPRPRPSWPAPSGAPPSTRWSRPAPRSTKPGTAWRRR